MRVAIVGNPYFSKQVVETLPKYRKDLKLRFYDTSHSLSARLAYVMALPLVDVVYAFSGSISGGLALKLALKFRKPIFQHFIGTDVLTAKEDQRLGRRNSRLLQHSRVVCDSPELVDELNQIQIPSKYAGSFLEGVPAEPTSLPADFSVLSYVRKGVEKFYGLDRIIDLAKEFPQVPFLVAGIEEFTGSELPSNLKLLGWVDDLRLELLKCSVYLRLTEHDGNAHSVNQALGLSRWVLWTNSLSGVIQVTDQKSLHEALGSLHRKFLDGSLRPNLAGHSWVYEHFDQAKVAQNLIGLLEETASGIYKA